MMTVAVVMVRLSVFAAERGTPEEEARQRAQAFALTAGKRDYLDSLI